jgi:hypothetical protein
MYRIRLPLVALILSMMAACESTAPTAPVDRQQPTASTVVGGDSITATQRGGTMIGSGN